MKKHDITSNCSLRSTWYIKIYVKFLENWKCLLVIIMLSFYFPTTRSVLNHLFFEEIIASVWTLCVFLSPVNFQPCEVCINPSKMREMETRQFFTPVWIQPYFTPVREVRFLFFYGVWPLRLLENHFRAKQDNLPPFSYYVTERSHPEVLSHKKIGILPWIIQSGDILKDFCLFLSIIISHSQETKPYVISDLSQRWQLFQN